MLEQILVPLDGSELAQKALEYATVIAAALKSTLHLLMVMPSPLDRTGGAFRAAAAFLSSVQLPRSENDLDMSRHPVYKVNEMASLEAEAKRQLLLAAERPQAEGVPVKVAVAFGRPAGGILNYAHDNGIDLIVMCTHGEGGPDSYAYGPTADRVARRATCPVMLIRPEEVSRVLPSPLHEDDPQ